MIKLTITYADQRPDWLEHFRSMDEAQAWLAEEQTRKYWDRTNTVQIQDLTPAPVVLNDREILAAKWAALRKERDAALAATDWCMLGDAPLDKEQKAIMANYRNALRHLPENSHDPDQLELPEYPKL